MIVIINELANKELSDFCEFRSDVIGYSGATYDQLVGLKSEQCVKNLVDYVTTGEYNINNKYVSFIGNVGYFYDRYNDKYRYINLAGSAAGLRAYTNNARNYWFASAGLNMGVINGAVKLAFNPNQGQRDLLYKNNINCVCSFPGQGIVLWGQKTMSRKPSAFDRVNVRMLFNYLERSIGKMSKYVLFEQNDAQTRNMFVSIVKPLFDQVKAGRGLTEYAIVCNDSNNTPLVVANNQLVATFLIKPTYVTEFITLNFVAVGPTISFSEAIGMV
jgi:phage tail sheath protein FI